MTVDNIILEKKSPAGLTGEAIKLYVDLEDAYQPEDIAYIADVLKLIADGSNRLGPF